MKSVFFLKQLGYILYKQCNNEVTNLNKQQTIMTKQEIDYFLNKESSTCKKCTCGTNLQDELVTQLKSLREELSHAMAPMMEPVYKQTESRDDLEALLNSNMQTGSIFEELDSIYESDLNKYEKAVLLYLTSTPMDPQSVKEIAEACSISTSSVKRVISTFMMSGGIMRAPYQSGYLLTKNKI